MSKHCDYMLAGFKRCQKRASHRYARVKSKPDGGTITRYHFVCSDHSPADSEVWPPVQIDYHNREATLTTSIDARNWHRKQAAIIVADDLCDSED